MQKREAQRVSKRARHDLSWNPLGPIGLTEESVDYIQILLLRIAGDREFATRPFHRQSSCLSASGWSRWYQASWCAMQSASISTSQSLLMKPLTSTNVQAGLIAENASPWARAASSQREISVSRTLVRITSCMLSPASEIACSMISRHRFV